MPPASTTATAGCATQGCAAVAVLGGGVRNCRRAGGPGEMVRHLLAREGAGMEMVKVPLLLLLLLLAVELVGELPRH